MKRLKEIDAKTLFFASILSVFSLLAQWRQRKTNHNFKKYFRFLLISSRSNILSLLKVNIFPWPTIIYSCMFVLRLIAICM